MPRKILENNKSALELMLSENIEQAVDYKAQIAQIDQELEDLGKPVVTPGFLDKISETITEAIENIDLEDGISCDFELDYDNKVTISDARFDNTQEIADQIYCAVEKLFAEIKTDNS